MGSELLSMPHATRHTQAGKGSLLLSAGANVSLESPPTMSGRGFGGLLDSARDGRLGSV